VRYNYSFLFLITLIISGAYISGCQNAETVSASDTQSELADSLKETSPDSIRAKGLISVLTAHNLQKAESNFVLFEVSKKDNYATGHLPGALQVWRPDYENKLGYEYGGMRATKEEMQTFLSERGVLPTDKIIIYDIKGSCDAIRLAWILGIYGHEDIEVINGGKSAWKKAGYDLTADVSPVSAPSEYRFTKETNESGIATLEDIKNAINNPNIVIVDTREKEEYLGQPYISKGKLYPWKKGAATYGCIPKAVHLNWSDAVELSDDHRFKSLKDLKYNFTQVGITPDKEIIVYCQSGVRSAHTSYVLREILGYPDVKNYDGSWIEWSHNFINQANVPIERHTSEQEHKELLANLQKKLSVK
jgi:thiosulfate/3-mercaptopyruvate sulfurtransferase